MANVKVKGKDIAQGTDILPRHLHGGTWKMRIRAKGKGSQTPGKKKRNDTCQLTAVAGLPRKAWLRSRGYKLKGYGDACAFFDKINK